MREAQLVPAPIFPPGTCFGCGGNEGEMVDTMVDVVGEGRIYVCVRTCLPAWARLAGFATPDEIRQAGLVLDSLTAQVAALEADLVFERENKVVSVSDMLRLVDRRDAVSTPVGSRPWDLADLAQISAFRDEVIDEVEKAHEQTETVDDDRPVCTETKVDGTACTAFALPGRDICVAHSKRTVAARSRLSGSFPCSGPGSRLA